MEKCKYLGCQLDSEKKYEKKKVMVIAMYNKLKNILKTKDHKGLHREHRLIHLVTMDSEQAVGLDNSTQLADYIWQWNSNL